MTSEGKKLGLMSLTAIGIGGMVGGGIFAVLGLAASVAKGDTPMAFIFSGSIALITSYAYAKLSSTFPSEGGTVAFLVKAFGANTFVGGINIMLWLSYVIMISLYAFTFGSYGSQLFSLPSPWAPHVMATAAILVFMAMNMLSASVVGEAEEIIVLIKVAILFVFVVLGVIFTGTSPNGNASPAPITDVLVGGMLIFVAYEGFELIANASKDARSTSLIPKSLYISVAFVICLYVSIAFVAIRSLTIEELIASKDYALASVAEPFLGKLGFSLIAFTALLSTSSAINATLYGSARISYVIAKEGELPEELKHKVWNKPVEGLFITAILSIVLVNTLNLDRIAILGSMGFILTFAMINMAHVKLCKHTGGSKAISILGTSLTSLAFVLLAQYAFRSDIAVAIIFFVFLIGCISMEKTYRAFTKRDLKNISC